mmetsp:Transcript_249/g.548  ORF Transcript_249/g.548 Transcript_249/m.548 type:complete len:82 (-) Transcript_249:1124-1369(-)
MLTLLSFLTTGNYHTNSFKQVKPITFVYTYLIMPYLWFIKNIILSKNMNHKFWRNKQRKQKCVFRHRKFYIDMLLQIYETF